MFKKIINFFKKKESMPVMYTGRVINKWEHRGWGNNIEWDDYSTGNLHGWLSHKPAVGDELREELQSGKIGRFRFEEVREANSVEDMFFAKVSPIGYLEN